MNINIIDIDNSTNQIKWIIVWKSNARGWDKNLESRFRQEKYSSNFIAQDCRKKECRRRQVKFLRLNNTGPFITAGYIAVSTKAFSFDKNPIEISSNVNMLFSRFTLFLKYYAPLLNVYVDLLTSKSNIFIKVPLLSWITKNQRPQGINVLLKFRLNCAFREVHYALI